MPHSSPSLQPKEASILLCRLKQHLCWDPGRARGVKLQEWKARAPVLMLSRV